MIYLVLLLWLAIAICILCEKRNIRLVIYLCVFSCITSVAFLLLGSPDSAMAEVSIGAFTTIFFVICFGKHSELKVDQEFKRKREPFHPVKFLLPIAFTALLFVLFLIFIPTGEVNTYLKDQYLALFMYNVGGENAVTAIYLGYRIYDTLFEALILVVAVVAVVHMSYSKLSFVTEGRKSYVGRFITTIGVLRIVCALILLFGLYLIMNGHISAGGGFQGGLFLAAFFICRYLVYDIYDIPITKVFKMEEFIFFSTVVLALFVVFLGMIRYLPAVFQDVYMIVMNFMIGFKVACGFLILFYRYIAIESR